MIPVPASLYLRRSAPFHIKFLDAVLQNFLSWHNSVKQRRDIFVSLYFFHCVCWNSCKDLGLVGSCKATESKRNTFWIFKKLFTAPVQRSAHVMGCDKCAALSESLPAGTSWLCLLWDTISAQNYWGTNRSASSESSHSERNRGTANVSEISKEPSSFWRLAEVLCCRWSEIWSSLLTRSCQDLQHKLLFVVEGVK